LEPLMRVAHYPTFGEPALKPPATDPVSIRTSYFTRLIDALHHSRRIEAARIVRRSQHLIQNSGEYDLRGIFERTHKEESD
jgi:hypothetical protein